jgi:hypothetical protein
MAITSYGYPVPGGVILPGLTWARMQNLLGRSSAIPFSGDWKPSANPGVARGVRMDAGMLGGGGILDISDGVIPLQLTEVLSGSQYFLFGAERTWGATNATVAKAIPGTAARAIPSFQDNPGTKQFHPVGLARVSAGNAAITDLVDLRCIAQEAGVYTIFDDLALQLIDRLGVTAYNKNTKITRRRVLGDSGPVWERVWDTTVGVRPYMCLGRDTFYPTDTPGGVVPALYSNYTNTDGDWQTHFGFFNGSTAANPSYIQVKTDGLYSINGRMALDSLATLRGWTALGGDWSRITAAVEARSNPGTIIQHVSDTVYLKAGAKVRVGSYFYDATRVRDWYLWLNRLGD